MHGIFLMPADQYFIDESKVSETKCRLLTCKETCFLITVDLDPLYFNVFPVFCSNIYRILEPIKGIKISAGRSRY